jgi:hypothetical protein
VPCLTLWCSSQLPLAAFQSRRTGKLCQIQERDVLSRCRTLVTVVLNVITNAAILAIPTPLLWRLKMPVQRKIVVALLLCSGLFVIFAAIVVGLVLTLGANPSALNINRWEFVKQFSESSLSNLPILKPLFSKSFWSKSSFRSTSLSHGISHNIAGLRWTLRVIFFDLLQER